MPSAFVPINEAARILRVSRRTIWYWISRGIPVQRAGRGRGRTTLVDLTALALALGRPGLLESREDAREEPPPPPLPQKRQRRDAGTHRIPPDLLRIIIGLIVEHPRLSAARILRIIELNDPDLLVYRPYPGSSLTYRLSEATIRRIRASLERIPAMRYALMDEDGRREFLRVWAGKVLPAHPNELWIGDMTRCDVMVYDPENDRPFRFRIHAIIDAFSGAIPAFVFTEEEGQRATDMMFALALSPKDGLGLNWPVYGTPKRLYLDNGKVYRSDKTESVARRLGIEIVYSRPYVAHSRGSIEQFFRTFHKEFEQALPGYAGEDATSRSSWELDRLLENTRKWWAKGAPPEEDPYPNRLLLPDEYKAKALAWLLSDYHTQVVHQGLSRVELWAKYVPQETLVRYDLGDLMNILSRAERRVVRGNGTVQYRNRLWTDREGRLVAYQGLPVIVLENEILPGAPLRVAVEERGELRILGELIPEPTHAASPEAQSLRKKRRAVLSALAREAESLREELSLPSWRLEATLERLTGLVPPPPRPEPRPQPSTPPGLPRADYRAQLEEELRALEASGDPIYQALKLGFIPAEERNA